MRTYRVTQILDFETYIVLPKWNWRDQSGDRVRPKGYDGPLRGTPGTEAKWKRLHRILLDKQIQLRNGVTIHQGRLVCDVFVDGEDLMDLLSKDET